MNEYAKMVSDVSPFFSTPCTMEFKNCNGDTYIGIVRGIDGFYSLVPRQKKGALLGGMLHSWWVARVTIARYGYVARYLPVDRILIQPEFDLPLVLVSSRRDFIDGIERLHLISKAAGEETLIISKDEKEFARLKQWLADYT